MVSINNGKSSIMHIQKILTEYNQECCMYVFFPLLQLVAYSSNVIFLALKSDPAVKMVISLW